VINVIVRFFKDLFTLGIATFFSRCATADVSVQTTFDPHPEFDAWRWAQLGELQALAVEFKRAIYEDLAREFARFGA
jgi:putative (di)nucleoside polyphosphate hydrolase